MARPVGAEGAKTLEAIREAGVKLIYKHGYEAMGLRQLAAEVGIQIGSIYNHIRTKQDLLFDLIKSNMQIMIARLDDALEGFESPEEKLDAFIEFHLQYHTQRRREAFLCVAELRSLDQMNYRVIAKMKRRYEAALVDILKEGMRAGAFRKHDPQAHAAGILSMLTGVSTWYQPEGRLTLPRLIEEYSEFIYRGLAADE